MKSALFIVIGIAMVLVSLFSASMGRFTGYEMGFEGCLRQLETEFKHEIAKGTDFMFLGHNCYGLKEGGIICKERK